MKTSKFQKNGRKQQYRQKNRKDNSQKKKDNLRQNDTPNVQTPSLPQSHPAAAAQKLETSLTDQSTTALGPSIVTSIQSTQLISLPETGQPQEALELAVEAAAFQDKARGDIKEQSEKTVLTSPVQPEDQTKTPVSLPVKKEEAKSEPVQPVQSGPEVDSTAPKKSEAPAREEPEDETHWKTGADESPEKSEDSSSDSKPADSLDFDIPSAVVPKTYPSAYPAADTEDQDKPLSGQFDKPDQPEQDQPEIEETVEGQTSGQQDHKLQLAGSEDCFAMAASGEGQEAAAQNQKMAKAAVQSGNSLSDLAMTPEKAAMKASLQPEKVPDLAADLPLQAAEQAAGLSEKSPLSKNPAAHAPHLDHEGHQTVYSGPAAASKADQPGSGRNAGKPAEMMPSYQPDGGNLQTDENPDLIKDNPAKNEKISERKTIMPNTSDIKVWKDILTELQSNSEQNEVVIQEIQEEISLQEQRNKLEVKKLYEQIKEQTAALEKLLQDVKKDTLFTLPADEPTRESFIKTLEERLENSRQLMDYTASLLDTQTTAPETIEKIRFGSRSKKASGVRAQFPRQALLGNWIHYFTRDMFTCQCFWDDGEFKEYDFRDNRLVEERNGKFHVDQNRVVMDYDEGKQAVYTVTGYSDDCLDYLINKTPIRFDYMPEDLLNTLLEENAR